jgi:hypothetical protein
MACAFPLHRLECRADDRDDASRESDLSGIEDCQSSHLCFAVFGDFRNYCRLGPRDEKKASNNNGIK